MSKDRSAKITKHGKVSVKLKADEWEAIEKALRVRMIIDEHIEMAQWCLCQEILEKLEATTKLSMQFRQSEFHALFDAKVFQHIDATTSILIMELFEQVRKEYASRIQHEQATYRALVKRETY